MESYWGVDLGGTKIEGVVLGSLKKAEPLLRKRVPTQAELGYTHIIAQVVRLVEEMVSQSGLRPLRIGIGHPGAIEPRTQLLKNSNTTVLNGKPFKTDLETALGLPVEMANDANCFALAETYYGAAKGASVVFGVILGTGVGGGIVVNQQILVGAQGIAGEWGHNVLDANGPSCYCGKSGCVEALLSGPALEIYYRSLSGKSLSLREIVAAAEQADPYAAQTLARAVRYFGRAISYVINILDPDVIVLGGGVSNIPKFCAQGAEAAVPFVMNDQLETKIVQNTLGDSAGVFGAAMLTACPEEGLSVYPSDVRKAIVE